MLPGWAGGAGQSWQSWGNRGGGAIGRQSRTGIDTAIADRQSRTGIDTAAITGAIAGQSRTGIDIGTIAGSRGRVSRSRTGIDTAPGIDQPESPAARHQAGPPLPPPRGNRGQASTRQSRTGNRGQASTRRQSRGQSRGNRGQASTSARSRVAADGSVDRGQASTRPQASTSPNPRRRATRPGRPYPRPESSPLEADRPQGVRSRASPLADSAAACGDASVDFSPDAGAASSTSAK